jgi:hypothetical protein
LSTGHLGRTVPDMLCSMPESHRVLLVRAISTSDHPLDDDELSDRTGIRPRQAVNQVLRRLESEGLVTRTVGDRGKIVTRLNDAEPVAAGPSSAPAVQPPGQAGQAMAVARRGEHELPPGSSREQRDAERVMLDRLGDRLGRRLEPARIGLRSGARVEIDGADTDHSVLVECWAHQGPPKGGQKHKVLTDALKLTWIATTIYPRPELVLCMSDPVAAAPFLPQSKSWAAQALADLGIRIEIVELPEDVRIAVVRAQERQRR